jgi:hypothetical protein
MRKRITTRGLFRRTAAPDEFSGRNLNTPISLYDIKPNARFAVGSDVTFVDSRWMKLRGTVLGHVAEDRLWVQWPNEIRQMDVDEVVGFDEIGEGAAKQTGDSVSASRGSRQATIISFDEIDRFSPKEDEEDEDLEYIPDNK